MSTVTNSCSSPRARPTFCWAAAPAFEWACRPWRSDRSSAFAHLFVNRWLWGSIALAVLLQLAVVHLAFLNLAFGTVPLSLEQWALCTAMASAVLWTGELRKLVVRAWGLA